MNDEPNSLHPWIEPELEARLTALVLGEASDFERDELGRLLADRPELALYQKRLETMHRLLREVAKGESGEEAGGWRLAEERREALLEKLGAAPAREEAVVVMSGRKRRLPWGLVIRIAACVAVAALVLGLMLARSSVVLGTAPRSADGYAYYDTTDGMSRNDWSFDQSGRATVEELARPAEPANGRFGRTDATPPPAPTSNVTSFDLEGSSPFTDGVVLNGGTLVVENRDRNAANEPGTAGSPAIPKEASAGGTVSHLDLTYDHTRSQMLRELAEGWEAPVPPSAPAAATSAPAPVATEPKRADEEIASVEREVSRLESDARLLRAKIADKEESTPSSPTVAAITTTAALASTAADGDGAVKLSLAQSEKELVETAEVDREMEDRRDLQRGNVPAEAPAPVSGPVSGVAMPRSESLAAAPANGVEKKLKQNVEKLAEVEQLGTEVKSEPPLDAPANNRPVAGKDLPTLAFRGVSAARGVPAAPAAAPSAQTPPAAEKPATRDLAESADLAPERGATVTKSGAGTLSIHGGVAFDAPMEELQAGQNTYTGGTEVTAGRTFALGGTVAAEGKPQSEEFRFIQPGAKAPAEPEFAMRKLDAESEAKGAEVSAGEVLAMGSGGAVRVGGDFDGRNAVEFDRFVNPGDGQGAQTRTAGSTDLNRVSEVDKSVQDILALTPQVRQGQQSDSGTLYANSGHGGVMGFGGGTSVAGSGAVSSLDESENDFLRQKAPDTAGFGFETSGSTNEPVALDAYSLSTTLGGTSTATPSADLFTTVYQVPPTFLASSTDGASVGDPFAEPVQAGGGFAPAGRTTAKQILESAGISFPEGAAAIYNPETSQLIVRNTKDQSELVEAYIEGIGVSEPTPEPKAAIAAALDETSPEAEPFSTFSLHVSDVSFQLAKTALASGKWPEAEKIRIEEFVNAFDYGDPVPSMGERVSCRIDQGAHPFLQQRNLARIALRTAEAGRSSGTPLRLTLLLDSSGSMERPDRRETVRRAFATLAGLLGKNDRVTLVSFARQPRLVADAVAGNEAMKLAETVAALPSEGGTNLEAALQLAFEKAREHQEPNAQNRIVLLTDGAANLGDAKAESLGQRVELMREAGIAFDAAGFGAEGLNDEILEALTRKGDGRYYLLDRPEDAEDAFAKQIAGALRPAAKNVKVQVEFNPDRVKSYKLLGFEKHRLATEDFRNDAVDAAELAAAEAGVAVYQVEPIPGGEGDLGSVSVRFRDLDSGEMVERRWGLPHLSAAPSVDQGGEAILLATVASQFAAKLAGGPLGDVVDLGELARLAAALPESERVKELRTMIEQARGLEGAR